VALEYYGKAKRKIDKELSVESIIKTQRMVRLMSKVLLPSKVREMAKHLIKKDVEKNLTAKKLLLQEFTR
jgi:transcription initiation factor TFIIIB Brf1 subunit/transcription initiation factor TFIIB